MQTNHGRTATNDGIPLLYSPYGPKKTEHSSSPSLNPHQGSLADQLADWVGLARPLFILQPPIAAIQRHSALFHRQVVAFARIAAVLLLLANGRSSPTSAAEPTDTDRSRLEIVGYLPSYRLKSFDFERVRLVTDVVLFSIEPRPDASLNDSRLPEPQLQAAIEQIRQRGARVHVTVGGWGQSAAFGPVTADKTLRLRLARNLIDYSERHGLDGLDIDWEHPANDAEREHLGLFLESLHSALRPHHRTISLAVTSATEFSPRTLRSVDRFHLMAYDNGGRHSTLQYARSGIEALAAEQVSKSSICLGIPFYGRPFRGPFGKAITYSDIVERHQPRPNADEAEGIYFNGPETVTAKVRLAQEQQIAGVMIWELGQDSRDTERSLLEAIHRASLGAGTSEPRP